MTRCACLLYTSPVQFHGSTIFVVTHKGEPYAPIKPIVEDIDVYKRQT